MKGDEDSAKLKPTGVWENRIAWAAALLLAGILFIFYYAASRGASEQMILPLDDAYIHLQYARQLAAGQPFVYNPGEPPTSGATSLLYPVLLAIGAAAGLRGLSLGVWAVVIGTLAFACSIFLIYRIARLVAPWFYALAAAVVFGVSGLFVWHAMSGMETLLATVFALSLLYGVASARRGWVVWAAVLLAVTRPEGAVGALLASAWLAWRARVETPSADARTSRLPRVWIVLIPLLAIGLQPLLNVVVTGSFSATGGQAKSLLNSVAPMDVIAGRIAGNFVRMWREWLLPGTPYGMFAIPGLAVVGIILVMWRGRKGGAARGRCALPVRQDDVSVATFAFVLLWLLGTSALISTLDTAFWHFRRYQIPMLALFFPLAAWGAAALTGLRSESPRRWTHWLASLLFLAALAGAIVGQVGWMAAYAQNVGYVRAQPLAMAEWLAANAAEDAVVAVHDVGMMRYVGGRETLDMVGLTTPGAALSWRQGPGAVGEWLVQQRPDLIAAYGEGHGLGLNYFLETDLYADPLATYRVTLAGEDNVALAAATQGIYRPVWATSENADLPRQAALREYWSFPGMALIDSIDVADLADEAAHDYAWRSSGVPVGFPTEFFQFSALDCGGACLLADGGRRINAEETFRVQTQPGRALLLVTRVQAAHPGALDIYADDVLVGTRSLPFLPGEWYELMTFVPPELIDGDTRFRIVPRLAEGDYLPYQHWVYQSEFPYAFAVSVDAAQAFYQDGRFSVNWVDVVREGDRLDVTLNWMNGLPGEPQAQGDYLAFVHIYGDPDAPPVAQADRRPANGTLPPGNWLPGMLIDTFMLDLSLIPPGRYQVAVGFYDPYTFVRLQPTLAPDALPQFEAGADGRLWVGELAINDAE